MSRTSAKLSVPNRQAPSRRTSQLPLAFRPRGGSRPGSGRKRSPARAGLQAHVGRPRFDRHVPALVTLRAVAGVPSFRSERLALRITSEIRRASAKGFRVVHFSIQTNHLHLIVEADDRGALSRGMQRLASRVAMAVNQVVTRRGTLWRDRYHRRDLASPRQYRSALVYTLFNARKHAEGAERKRRLQLFDAYSSSFWTDDWIPSIVEPVRAARAGPSPVVPPKTWMARRGWLRYGKLRPDETPRALDAAHERPRP